MKLLIVLMIILLSHGSDVKSRRGRMNLANPSYEAGPEFISELTSTVAKRSQIEDTTENGQSQTNFSDAQDAILHSMTDNIKVIYNRTNQTGFEKMVDMAKTVHHHFFLYAVESVCEDKNAVYSPMDEEALRIQLDREGYNIASEIFRTLRNDAVYRESVSSGFNEGLKHCPEDVEAYEARYNSSLLNESMNYK